MSVETSIFATDPPVVKPTPEEERINTLQTQALDLAAQIGKDDDRAYVAFLECTGHTPGDEPDHYPQRFRTLWTAAKKRAATDSDPLARIRDALNLPTIERIAKHGRRGEAYVLELQDGTHVDLGNASQLFLMRQFDAAIMAQAHVLPPARSAKAHRVLVGRIEDAAEQLDTVASPTEETMGWIAGYVGDHVSVVHVDDAHALYDALSAAEYFRDTEGRLYLRLPSFSNYVRRMCSTQVTVPDLSRRLSQLGFQKNQKGARRGTDSRKRRLWISPPGFEVTG